MALKSYKPTTPGQRGLVLIDRSELYKGRPVKALTQGLTKSGGRNNTGRITMRRMGGGAKRLYRIVDFKRTKFDKLSKRKLQHLFVEKRYDQILNMGQSFDTEAAVETVQH